MGQLTGNQIDLSYQGLIKTTDNAAIGAVEKEITDGVGTASTLKLGTTSASFVGTLDLTGATVTGLPAAASGLVSGTGTDSMKSADTLTPLATNLAGGQNAIVFGAGAIGNQDYGITIGTYAQSGIFSTTVGTYAEGSGLYCSAYGPSSKATADGAVAVGQLAQGLSAGSISLGRQSLVDATSTSGIAIGDSAEVASAVSGAVALGAGVIAATADTVSVKALETQTASTPTAGGVIMTDAGSVARRLNITAAGALQIDSTPVGGGGGGSEANEGQAITPCLAINAYSIPWILSGYSQTGGKTMTANTVQYIPFYAKAGEAISDFRFDLQTAQAAATMDVGLYKGYVSTVTGFKTVMPEFVATIASAVDVSTTGTKNFTGLNISLPADAEGGLYWIGFISDTSMVALKIWSNWVAAERIIYNGIYRGTGVEKAAGSFALPTGQIDLSSGVTSTTDLPVDFQWRYKS